MNNYMYGKAGKADYTVSDMPKNRFELFGEVLKVRWASLFGVNLLYMIVWLPTLIWSLINVFMILSTDGIAPSEVRGYLLYYFLLLVPCVFITGPFTAGFTYVHRNWARDEHSFVWSDYWEAVRGNWKSALVVSLLSGLAPLVAYVGYTFYSGMGASSPLFYLPMGILLLVVCLWKLSEATLYTMMVTYDLKLRHIIQNALLMTVARLPQAIGIKLLTFAVPAIGLILAFLIPDYQIVILLIMVLLYLLWIPAFNRLIQCSFANYVCEKYLNPNIEGARTNIGLRPENWDDTEYIPQDDEEDTPKET